MLILRTLSLRDLRGYSIVQFILARIYNSQTMCSSPQFSRKYALSILTGIVLCSTALNSGCSKTQNDHPNTAEGTSAALKEIIAVVGKSLAGLPVPPSVPAVCEDEITKLREVSKTSPGTEDAATANSALLRCTSKATNETNCKGKPQPCGVVYFTPPIKPLDPGQPASELSEPRAVDVSVQDQIAAACKEIAGAGDAVSSTSAGADAADDILASVLGKYSCGAWFKAAAKNDPTLLIVPTFVPTTQLLRDLRTYTNGDIDVTPEAVLASKVKRVDRGVVAIQVGGTIVPVAVLWIVPVGGTPGQVLDGAHETVQQRVNQVGKAVGDGCKAVGICQ